MKRYVVTLQQREREELAGITRKGSHRSQKVLNALILLNCDEGEFNERRAHGEAIALGLLSHHDLAAQFIVVLLAGIDLHVRLA